MYIQGISVVYALLKVLLQTTLPTVIVFKKGKIKRKIYIRSSYFMFLTLSQISPGFYVSVAQVF